MPHHWHFMKTTLLGQEQVGPVSEAEFTTQIKNGTIKKATAVNSPTRTKGQWVEAGTIPTVSKMLEKVEAHQAEQNAEQKHAAKVTKAAEKQAASVQKAKHKESKQHAKSEKQQAASLSAQNSTTWAILSPDGTATCSFCHEPIQFEATKCRHCGEFLDKQLREDHLRAITPAKWHPGVAAVLSFIIPGLGQIYKGQVFNGLVWLAATILGYLMFIIPGLVLHFCCIFGAAMGDPKK